MRAAASYCMYPYLHRFAHNVTQTIVPIHKMRRDARRDTLRVPHDCAGSCCHPVRRLLGHQGMTLVIIQ
eukprot:5540735-Prymnesium_polylepis.1